MTIFLSFLGIYLVNVLFIFIMIGSAARRNGLSNGYNFPYLIFLLRHPLMNLICLYSIFALGSEGLDEIVKNKMEGMK